MSPEEYESVRSEYIEAIQKALMTINQVRDVYGRPPVDGGDTAFVMTRTGAVPVEQLYLYFMEKNESY